jgi:hypothetical protein
MLWLALVAGLFFAAPAVHGGLVLDLTTGGTASTCDGCGVSGTTFGWSFAVTSPITVTGIGVWDAGSDGIGVSVGAGLYTSAGVPLAIKTISDASAAVASASTDGRWLFEYFAPFVLAPGDYVIGSVFYETAPLVQFFAPHVEIPEITFGEGRYGTPDAGLTAPDNSYYPVFGPTLEATGAPPIPEPGTLGMLALGGLAFILASRRRTR